MTQLLPIFFAHWIGDYVLQTTPMATRKHTSIHWLSAHVAVYTSTLFVAFLFLVNLHLAIYLALINGALHWVTDFFTSKLAHRYANNPRVFFPVLGFDQLIHSSCLLLTMTYLGP